MELSPALLLFWFASLPLIAQSGDKFDVSGILRLTDRPPEATPVEALAFESIHSRVGSMYLHNPTGRGGLSPRMCCRDDIR
jgi:hypothetical protein